LQSRPAAVGSPSDWVGFGYDTARTGYNPSETTIGVSNVGTLTKIWQENLGPANITQPLFVKGLTVPGIGTADMLFVTLAGSSGTAGRVLGLNAATGGIIWYKDTGARDPCPNTAAQSIGGTGTIDRANGVLYVADGYLRLHRYSLTTGAEAAPWPQTLPVDGRFWHDIVQAALTYNPLNGALYVPLSSGCEPNYPWLGGVMYYNTTVPTAPSVKVMYTEEGTLNYGGSIWGFGGVSIDPLNQNVFFGTGPSQGGPLEDAYLAEKVISLDPRFAYNANDVDAPTPPFTQGTDDDFGSTPVLYQVAGCPPQLVIKRKDGILYVYDRDYLRSGPVQGIQMSQPSTGSLGGSFIGTLAWDPIDKYLLITSADDQTSAFGGFPAFQHGITAFSINSSCKLQLAWHVTEGAATLQPTSDTPYSMPVVANGVVYFGDGIGNTLYAHNAKTGALLLKKTVAGILFAPPVVTNGRLYLNDDSGNTYAFALPQAARAGALK